MKNESQHSGKAPAMDVKATVLLIDDQAMVGEAVRRMLADEPGINFHYCQDPTQAIPMALRVCPTVILQDLVMPEIDGLSLVKFFRANEKTRDVPLIVLSSKEEATVKAQAFALGANDYLVKLPDKVELIARIRYHSRGYIALLQRNAAMEQLYAELAEAAQYVTTLLPAPISQGPVTCDWRFVPSTALGGDTFGYHWLDDKRFAAYLLDVCGHGVGAALLSVSAMNVLRAETLPNTDFGQPAEVLARLNEAFDMDKHNGMYFTMWYGVFDFSKRVLRYASGGHPPAFLFHLDNGVKGPLMRLATKNMIVGGMPGVAFRQDEIEIKGPALLYLFSDGVYEITKSDGTMWTLDEFAQFMSLPEQGETSPMDALAEHARKISAKQSFDDDFSILEICFARKL